MKRAAVAFSAAAVLALVAGLWSLARASTPITCTWPGSPDNFQAVVRGNELTPELWNQVMCAINKLEEQVSTLLSAPAVPQACQADTWQPAERKAVTLTYSTSFTGSEPVYATVISQSSPSFLVVDGVEPPSGSSVQVWIFNHDAQLSQTGTVCARVIQ